MARPGGGYYTEDGKRVPGVTTVIGNCKIGGIDPLLWWANQEGLAGRNFRESRDKEAHAGTCGHDMVECDIRQIPFDPTKYDPAIVERATPAFAAYKEWAAQSKLKTVAAETSLVSEQHRYGGTLDAVLVNDKMSLGDWKTSNGVYPDYLCQLAAYKILWEETYPNHPIVGGFHLLRFSKQDHPDDPVHFTHHYWSDLDLAWTAFEHMLALYDLNKRLKKLT